MWYTAPAHLLKAETNPKDSSRIDIVILASDEELDDENDNVYSSAFTKEVREKFLSAGHFDYDHNTIRGSNPLEKATAFIGTPTKFYQDTEKGAPVQYAEGYLHRGNPYVDNVIEPALRAKSDRLSASLGGRILGFEPNIHGGKGVHRLTLNHIAITPLFKAINKRAWVRELVKSGKLIEFSTVYDLCKSLEAGSVTDSAKIIGAQALQPQSLEGKKVVVDFLKESFRYPFSKAVGKHVIIDILEEEIDENYDSIVKRAKLYGLNDKQSKVMAKMILINLSKSIRRIKKILNNQQGKRSLLKTA